MRKASASRHSRIRRPDAAAMVSGLTRGSVARRPGIPGRSTRREQEQGGGSGHVGRADHEDLIAAAPSRDSARPGIGRLSAVTVGIC